MADYQLRKFTFNRYNEKDELYTITHEDIVDKRSTPHKSIPIDESNKDYLEYLEWVKEGNTADPAE